MQKPAVLLHSALITALLSAACAPASSPRISTPGPAPPVITWAQKLSWIVRLEDQRLLRDPNPPPAVVLRPATAREPAIVAPPPPSDLIRLLHDPEARVRRRAALAAGRVGLPGAVPALVERLADDEPEVRQMAAFALGLLGNPAARTALVTALTDAAPVVQGRAAEALGAIGDKADALAIATMVRAQMQAGAWASIEADDLRDVITPEADAARLGIYALGRLGDFDALASAALDANSRPVSRWWPVAFAFQRVRDARAVGVLVSLVDTPGRYTAALAIKGLAALAGGSSEAVPRLRQIVEARTRDGAVVVEAVKALAAIGDAHSSDAFIAILDDPDAPLLLRAEAVTALATSPGGDAPDVLLDLLSDRSALIRARAVEALARLDAQTLITALSGMDVDRDWTVRAAIASALGRLQGEQALPRLQILLRDDDPRVVPAAIRALARTGAPEAVALVRGQLAAADFAIRAAAATALADLRDADAVPMLVAAYHRGEGDSTYVARAAALAAISRLDPRAAPPILDEALQDREWAVRERARTLLVDLGVAVDLARIRPAAAGRRVDDPALLALLDPPYSPHAFIETSKGTIEIELAILDAPLTVENFMALARRGFFDGVSVHRVVPDFVVQDGDPRGDGEGGPGYTIRDEINERPYLRGTVGMALDWRDTGGSQFFITHAPQPQLDGRYTVFGTVVTGMDIVDRIVPGDVVTRVRIWDGGVN